MCTLKGMPTLEFTTRRTAPRITRRKKQARGRVGGLQPKPFHGPLKCMHLNRQCQHGKSTSTRNRRHKQPNNEEANHHKEPHHNNPYNSENLEQSGNCSHMPPGTSMANITAHALPSGHGEKMKIDRPTNDPRPFLRQTRKTNSITNPPFTRKAKPSAPNREEANNITRSQFQWSHTWLPSAIKIFCSQQPRGTAAT
jgi:hypothetical protein